VEKVDVVCPEIGAAHIDPECHWYVYGGVPCEPEAVSVTDCPESNFGAPGETEAVNTGLMSNFTAAEEVETDAPLTTVTQ